MEHKSNNKWLWIIFVAIFGTAIIFMAYDYWRISYYEQQIVTSYYIYTYSHPMQDGETFKGIQMQGHGRLDYLDAIDDNDAERKANEIVKRKIEMYQRGTEKTDPDGRNFCEWQLRNLYALLSIKHRRGIGHEVVEKEIAGDTDNFLQILISLENNGYEFHIIDEDLKD